MRQVADFGGTEGALNGPVDRRAVRPLLTFERFVEQEQERLLRALSVITGSRREAEDLAQEAFTKVFERWDAVALMDEPAGYLHRTAMNLFRNQYRRARVAIGRAVGSGPPQDGDDRRHRPRTNRHSMPNTSAATLSASLAAGTPA